MKKETLGQVLKQRREAYALTQRELAHKLGVKASHVAYLENGRRRPSLSLLARLADTLELDKQRKGSSDPGVKPRRRSGPKMRGANSSRIAAS
jgi:transcriptional regulator with XRE-family HTH domain